MIERQLLKFAVKSKNFMGELSAQAREEFFSAPFKEIFIILSEYFKTYKEIPSSQVILENANEHFKANSALLLSIKKELDVITNNNDIVDGDFPYLLNKFKKKYNEDYLKGQIHYMEKCLETSTNIDEVNQNIKKMALEINAITTTQIREQGTLQESAKYRFEKYKEIKERPEIAKGVYVGYKGLDTLTNGFKGSELILVSGPTSSGKSVLLMNMAINAWLGNNTINMEEGEWDSSGRDVWFITIENPKEMLERRIDSCLAGVASDHIRDGRLTPEEEVSFRKSLKFQYNYGNNKKFFISDLGRGISPATIEAEYEKILPIFKPEIIVIDYLNIMRATNPTGTDWLDQGSIAADLHELGRNIKDAPILTASQMKSGMRTQNGIKRFSGDPESVARSKMITDNVNMNLQINKDEDFHNSSYMDVYVAKNRDGKTGDVFRWVKEFWRQKVHDSSEEFSMIPNEANNG